MVEEDIEENPMEKEPAEDKDPNADEEMNNNDSKSKSNSNSNSNIHITETLQDKVPEEEPQSPKNNDDADMKDEKKDDDEVESSPITEEPKENSDDDARYDETDTHQNSKAQEKEQEEPFIEDDDDQPNGPTLQDSIVAAEDADAEDVDVDEQAGPTLQFTFQQNVEDIQEEIENEKPTENATAATTANGKKRPRSEKKAEEKEEEFQLLNTHVEYEDKDPQTIADKKTVGEGKPASDLELALARLLTGKENHVAKLTNEIKKLKGFISKRKQTYKRKRKDEGAPTRALSAYNIFVQDQFAKLAKKNSAALQSTDTNAQLERVPPANLVASTGGVWKNLPDIEKQKFRERAKLDRKRYDEQMAKYQPPDKAGNRKRNKTGYNMFFSAHVLRLKQSELGVPSERGSVARLVGTAWKQLSAEEKQYYEREADKHNGMNPVDKGDHDKLERDENTKESVQMAQQQAAAQQAVAAQAAAQQQQVATVQDPYAAHAAAVAGAQYNPHDISTATGYAHAMHAQAAATQNMHDPRVAAAAHHGYYYAHPHAAAYHYDYGVGHHNQQPPPGVAQQPPQQQQQQPLSQQHPGGRGSSRGQYQYGQQQQQQHGYYDK